MPAAEPQGCSRPVGCTSPNSARWARPTPPAEAAGWPPARPARFASPPGPAGCNATRQLPAPQFRFALSSSWVHRRPAPAPLVCWVRPRGHLSCRHRHHCRWGCDYYSPTCSCCRRRGSDLGCVRELPRAETSRNSEDRNIIFSRPRFKLPRTDFEQDVSTEILLRRQ